MLNESIKKEVQKLISKARIEEALNALSAHAFKTNNAELTQSTTLLKGNFATINQEKTMGFISYDDANIRANKLGNSVLELLKDVGDVEETPQETNNIIITKTISVPKEFKGGVFSNSVDIKMPQFANEVHVEVKKPKIYFSYAWANKGEKPEESREKIVGELYESLKNDGYEVMRDKEIVGFKDSILEFMRDISSSDFIVVAISDKYLKSANCMFELLGIYRKSNSDLLEFKAKIYPIVLGDAKIYDPMDRLQYLKYWKAKKAELEKEINEIGLAETIEIIGKDYKNYKEITDNIGLISTIISELNTLNPELLSKDNFEEIKKAIAKRISETA